MKATEFINKHKFILIGFVVGLILFFIGLSFQSSASSTLKRSQAQLAAVRDNIAQFEAKKNEVTTIVNHLEHGLNPTAQAVDRSNESVMRKWIKPAFDFKNANQYLEARAEYVDYLGGSNEFVTMFMPDYTPVRQSFTNDAGTIDDGTNIKCTFLTFSQSLVGMDEANGVYSYVGFVTCKPEIPTQYDYAGLFKKGNSSEMTFILTYDMADGKISNLHIVAKSTEK